MRVYLPILCMIVLVVLFASLSFVASKLLGPKRPTSAKQAPYECGIVPDREPAERFPVRFYLVAMIFIIFDIEIIFLFPWAVTYRRFSSGIYPLGIIAEFTIPFVIAFAWLVSQGGLDWGPVNRGRRFGVDPTRTTDSTIRRVGLEGRPYVAEDDEVVA